jgi:alginate O-acetyltransferase complex protein AlgI
MVFADLTFLYLFLPANILLYYLTRSQLWRNLVLVAFSLFFYAWGEPLWITLLIFSATIDYFHGLLAERFRGGIGAQLALLSSVTLNLGLLGLFKYGAFVAQNLTALLGTQFFFPPFSLPIGFSFYPSRPSPMWWMSIGAR